MKMLITLLAFTVSTTNAQIMQGDDYYPDHVAGRGSNYSSGTPAKSSKDKKAPSESKKSYGGKGSNYVKEDQKNSNCSAKASNCKYHPGYGN